jgi:O-antigen ligase
MKAKFPISNFNVPNNPSKWADRVLHLTLFLLFFIPPLVFVPGRFRGQWIFVNYREPKLAAIQILAWLFLTVFWLAIWKDSRRRERLLRVIKDRWTWLLVAFILYLCWTAHRALVIEASFYELAQYWTLLNLYIALGVLWQEKTYFRTALVAISASLMIVTAIGLYQLWQPISFLIPLLEFKNPSTFGYKNPAALAVLGQIFLLLSLINQWGRKGRWGLAVAGGLVALTEVAYLATLQSRTSYFAFAVTIAFVLGFWLCLLWRRRIGALKIVAPVILAAVMVFGWILVSYTPAQKRVQMTVKYFREPASFLASDRGTYLLNSIYMAQKNLFGVGIGNWGFAYPVYRCFQPGLCFNERIQVMRAHGDYAQMLGETGWPGLVLWVVLLGWALARGVGMVWRSLELGPLFVVAQLLAFLLVMLFDYCIEMPYHKFAFFGVLAMVGALFAAPGHEND